MQPYSIYVLGIYTCMCMYRPVTGLYIHVPKQVWAVLRFCDIIYVVLDINEPAR